MDAKQIKQNPSHVQSVARALTMLELLGDANREMSLTEISRALGWPKTTVHGLITTLRDYSFVDQSAETGRYRLGVRIFELGSLVARGWDIYSIAKPAMQSLHNQVGELIQLGTEDNGEVLYIDKLDSTHMMRIVSDVGAKLPMHCTGLGKVLLAYKKPAEVKRIMAKHGMRAMTSRTITSLGALEKELREIKQQGYAIDDREAMDSLHCIAAPIFDQNGDVRYAMSISTLENNFPYAHFEQVRNQLIRAANSISYSMGYRETH